MPKIGNIYPDLPSVYPCEDGTYSTSSGRRACARHGGRRSDVPISAGGGRLNVQDVPLTAIKVDPRLFQGREKHFSPRSVENIIQAVQGGTFRWASLDPVTLWRSPEGQLYILSGHSRFEAFRKLAATGATAEGKTFDAIPSKIFLNLPKGDAQTVALESNTLSTKETDTERATYYRSVRDRMKKTEWSALIRKNEGRNAVNIEAYTYLSPTGKTWAALRAMIEGEDTSATLAKSLAKWIGKARYVNRDITDAQENEMYDFLFVQGGYGTGRGKVSNEIQFLDTINAALQKNVKGDYTRPLNLQQALLRSPVEESYDAQIQAARQDVADAEKRVKDKIQELTARRASRTDIQRIVQPLQAAVLNSRSTLATLEAGRKKVLEYASREQTLFGFSKQKAIRGYLDSVCLC